MEGESIADFPRKNSFFWPLFSLGTLKKSKRAKFLRGQRSEAEGFSWYEA